jgi:hypothetical protein
MPAYTRVNVGDGFIPHHQNNPAAVSQRGVCNARRVQINVVQNQSRRAVEIADEEATC